VPQPHPLKYAEAVEIVNRLTFDGSGREVLLACGFTPHVLEIYLRAHLSISSASRPVSVRTGLYGNLASTLSEAMKRPPEAAAVIVEWSDLDARLGIRHAAGLAPETLPDIGRTAASACETLRALLEKLARACPVALACPTLPLPPVEPGAAWQAGGLAARLAQLSADFAAGARDGGVRLAAAQYLDRVSPLAARFDVKSELSTGFPYGRAHAERLAFVLASLLDPPPPLKGVITDLDDTLWSGILGEVGVEGVTWSQEHHTQIHGLYQMALGALAASGTLVGVASKNDPALAAAALRRPDLLMPVDRLYPVKANWGAKSESVRAILKLWNIGAEAVMFVDDSGLEIAEVQAAFPEMHCRQFPAANAAQAYELIQEIRNRCGKPAVTEEDWIRLDSIRDRAESTGEEGAPAIVSDEFLRAAAPRIAFDLSPGPGDARALELVNKTNQFNLNGRRYTEADWRRALAREGAFLLVAGYRDKFGPLGRIAVLSGICRDGVPRVETWVMSCRAFGRRIEHCCLERLFAHFAASRVELDCAETPRNRPARDFLRALVGELPASPVVVEREQFVAACPPLFHAIEEPAYV
jgi:FkbH-like protein